ncbi:MAG: SGNH/GDSL hydrolase family protein, partial [Bacteroidota bacterium]
MQRLLLLALLVFTACSTPLGKRSFFAIGDSNGARQGWVYHLQQARGGGPLVNTALSGNTIGFNYGGDLSKNTLENLTGYLRTAYAELGEIDDILISLGTNDCK